MRLRYVKVFCVIALFYSGAAAGQPRAHFKHSVFNAIASSSSVPTTDSTKASTTTFHRTSNSTSRTKRVCKPVTSRSYGTGGPCISYCATRTFFSVATNATSTVTAFLTVFGNSTSFPSTQFAHPTSTLLLQPCPIEIPMCYPCSQPPFTVSLITSKTSTVTNVVSVPPVCFACEDNPGKVPANAVVSPTALPATTPEPDQLQAQQRPTPNLWLPANPTHAGDGNPSSPTVTVNGVPVGLPGSSVVIDGTPVTPDGGGPTTVTAGGQVFIVDPSQIIGPGTTIARPIAAASNPTPTVVDGVTLAIGPSVAVIGGTTFAITPGATPTTIVVNGVPLSIGPGGVGFPSTTITAPARIASATQVITAGGITFTEISSSLVVIGSSTFTIGPGATPTTDVVNGQSISIGPNGVGFASTTVLYSQGAGSASPMQISAGGLRYSCYREIMVIGIFSAVSFLV